ncbi:MAG: NACHT domain-containing protein [Myxococcales bacterium]|nr:NACHT domain-containing protein [Myxococcales bacterium]
MPDASLTAAPTRCRAPSERCCIRASPPSFARRAHDGVDRRGGMPNHGPMQHGQTSDGQPHAAWLMAAPGPGVDRDVRDLKDWFAQRLGVKAEAPRDGDGVSPGLILQAFQTMARSTGWLWVWLGGHGQLEDPADPKCGAFFATQTVHERPLGFRFIWRKLNALAEDRSAPVIAIVDCCHGGPPAGLALDSNLVAIIATHPGEVTRGTDVEGGWLTQWLLAQLRSPDAVTPNDLRHRLGAAKLAQHLTKNTPDVLVGKTRLNANLNAGTPARRAPVPAPAPIDGAQAWRHLMARLHRDLLPFRPQDTPEAMERVRVAVHVAVDCDAAGPETRALAERRPDTLEGLLRDTTSGPPRWFVTGAPGAGKTTLARWLVRKSGAAPDEGEAPLPLCVYVPLSAWSRAGGDALDFAVDRARQTAAGLDCAPDPATERAMRAALASAAARGELWLFLDGLDEVADNLADVHSWLSGLPAQLADAALVVLGRDVAFTQLDPSFRRAHVQPLARAAQLELLEPRVGAERAAAVLAHCERHALHDLLGNPLMLTLIGRLAAASGEALPLDEAGLFHEAVEILLRRGLTDDRNGIKEPTLARAVLAQASLTLHASGREDWPLEQVVDAVVDARVRPKLNAGFELGAWPDTDAFLDAVARDTGVLAPRRRPRRRVALSAPRPARAVGGRRAERRRHAGGYRAPGLR